MEGKFIRFFVKPRFSMGVVHLMIAAILAAFTVPRMVEANNWQTVVFWFVIDIGLFILLSCAAVNVADWEQRQLALYLDENGTDDFEEDSVEDSENEETIDSITDSEDTAKEEHDVDIKKNIDVRI